MPAASPHVGSRWCSPARTSSTSAEGKDLYLGVNAYVYAEPKGTK